MKHLKFTVAALCLAMAATAAPEALAQARKARTTQTAKKRTTTTGAKKSTAKSTASKSAAATKKAAAPKKESSIKIPEAAPLTADQVCDDYQGYIDMGEPMFITATCFMMNNGSASGQIFNQYSLSGTWSMDGDKLLIDLGGNKMELISPDNGKTLAGYYITPKGEKMNMLMYRCNFNKSLNYEDEITAVLNKNVDKDLKAIIGLGKGMTCEMSFPATATIVKNGKDFDVELSSDNPMMMSLGALNPKLVYRGSYYSVYLNGEQIGGRISDQRIHFMELPTKMPVPGAGTMYPVIYVILE